MNSRPGGLQALASLSASPFGDDVRQEGNRSVAVTLSALTAEALLFKENFCLELFALFAVNSLLLDLLREEVGTDLL
jgi:hypothetical protein